MYSGKVIDPNGVNGYDLEPDKLYPVYRPASELEKSCESFNGVQIRNEHEMMGDGAGMCPADSAPTGGTVFNVKMDGATMVGDLRIFGTELRNEIEGGKKQLSLGYFCKYKKADGEFDGQPYDFIQYDLEGNHLALVKEGRMGSSVRVFDSITFDQVEIPMKNKVITKDGEEQKSDIREEIGKMLEGKDDDTLAKVKDAIEGALKPDDKTDDDPCPKCGTELELKKESTDEGEEKPENGEGAEDEGEEKPDGEGESTDEEEEGKSDGEDCGDEGEEGEDPDGSKAGDSKAMDMKEVMREIAHRDRLVNGVAPYIGSFDASEMTAREVAVYALDKLEIRKYGDPIDRLEGYLDGRAKTISSVTTATDAVEKSSADFKKNYLK